MSPSLSFRQIRAFIWLLSGLALILVILFVPLPASASTKTHHITLDATQYEFNPSRLHIGQGDRVVITLTASDVVHGFYLDGYNIEQRVEPGVVKQIEFVANKAGKFRYRCTVSCGSLHPFMLGELVVGPNVPFWRALGVVMVVVFGFLVYLWQLSTGANYESKQALVP